MTPKQRFALTDYDCVLAEIAETEAKLAALKEKARRLEEACGPDGEREARRDASYQKVRDDKGERG